MQMKTINPTEQIQSNFLHFNWTVQLVKNLRQVVLWTILFYLLAPKTHLQIDSHVIKNEYEFCYFILAFCTSEVVCGTHCCLLVPRTMRIFFVMIAALTMNQWQHRTWTISLHPPITIKYEAADSKYLFSNLQNDWTANQTQSISFFATCSTNCTTLLENQYFFLKSCAFYLFIFHRILSKMNRKNKTQ